MDNPRESLIHFVVPVHNEEKILPGSLEKLLRYCQGQHYPFNWQVHVVVNGSTDRTLEIARRLQAGSAERLLVTDFPEPGRGAALKRAWLASQADIVMYMDVDLAVSLEHLAELLQPILAGESDLVIGSRNLNDSKIKRSLLREFISQSYNLLSRLILGHNFSDLQCGFKAIRLTTFQAVAPRLEGMHWFFDTELVLWATRGGFRVREIPVDWSENRYEQRKSKVRLIQDSWQFFLNLLRLRARLNRLGER